MAGQARPRALFVTYGGGHVATVLPVVERLLADGKWDPIVIALTTAGAVCRRAGIPYLGFKDLVPEGSNDVWEIGSELLQGKSHPEVELAESVAYHGLSFIDLVEEIGERNAREEYASHGRAAFRPKATMARAIERLSPSVVVTTNSPRAERAALEASRQLGVPSCCLIDAFGIRSDWLAQPGSVDRLCVMSEGVRDFFVGQGQRPEIVAVTGNPSFDVLASVCEQRRRRLPHAEYRILWAPHPEPDVSPVDASRTGDPTLNDRIARELVRCAESHPDWQVEMRPHPSQTIAPIHGPSNFSVRADRQLEERLLWADIVVTCASTVGLQATLVGLPAIAVCGSVVQDYVPLVAMKLAYPSRLDELEHQLRELREDPAPTTTELPELGRATERVIDELEFLVESPSIRADQRPLRR